MRCQLLGRSIDNLDLGGVPLVCVVRPSFIAANKPLAIPLSIALLLVLLIISNEPVKKSRDFYHHDWFTDFQPRDSNWSNRILAARNEGRI